MDKIRINNKIKKVLELDDQNLRNLNFHFIFDCFQSSIIWQTNYTSNF